MDFCAESKTCMTDADGKREKRRDRGGTCGDLLLLSDLEESYNR